MLACVSFERVFTATLRNGVALTAAYRIVVDIFNTWGTAPRDQFSHGLSEPVSHLTGPWNKWVQSLVPV